MKTMLGLAKRIEKELKDHESRRGKGSTRTSIANDSRKQSDIENVILYRDAEVKKLDYLCTCEQLEVILNKSIATEWSADDVKRNCTTQSTVPYFSQNSNSTVFMVGKRSFDYSFVCRWGYSGQKSNKELMGIERIEARKKSSSNKPWMKTMTVRSKGRSYDWSLSTSLGLELVFQQSDSSGPANSDFRIPLGINRDCISAAAFDSNPKGTRPCMAVLCFDQDPNKRLLKIIDIHNDEIQILKSCQLKYSETHSVLKEMCLYSLPNSRYLVFLVSMGMMAGEPQGILAQVFEIGQLGGIYRPNHAVTEKFDKAKMEEFDTKKEVKWSDLFLKCVSVTTAEHNGDLRISFGCLIEELPFIWEIIYCLKGPGNDPSLSIKPHALNDLSDLKENSDDSGFFATQHQRESKKVSNLINLIVPVVKIPDLEGKFLYDEPASYLLFTPTNKIWKFTPPSGENSSYHCH